MYAPHPRLRRRLGRLALASLLFVLPFLLLAPPLVWEARDDAQQRIEHGLVLTIRLLDHELDRAEQLARALHPLAGRPCDVETQLALRKQATSRLNVRSIELTADGKSYCSSLAGAVAASPAAPRYRQDGFTLRRGSELSPDVPFIEIHEGDGKRGVLVNIDGRYLGLLMGAERLTPQRAYIQANGVWVGPGFVAGGGAIPLAGSQHLKRASDKYPYHLFSSYDLPDWREVLLRKQRVISAMLLLLGAVLAGVGYWLLGRPRSPQSELRRALDGNEFEPFLQPLVRPGSTQWGGAEVLMRWRHPQAGLIPPDLFIPQAEASGVIVPMTAQMMARVARELSAAALPPGFHLGFNVSVAHFTQGDLYGECQSLLAAFPPGAVALTLELTERELLEATPAVEALFRRLRQLGVQVSLDDFGTGHSSLDYLNRLAVSGLKIDQSFVARIGANSLSGAIVDSVVELAGKLGLDTVAEGVETEQQAAYLGELGVTWLQGYLIAKPMPLADFVAGLARQQALSAPSATASS